MATPLIYLSATEYISGDWLDKSGNGKHATIEDGTATKNSDGNGLVLDGQTCWTLPALELTEWTVGVWFKETAAPQPGGCIITQIFQPDSINLLIGDCDRNSTYRAGFYNSGFSAGPVIAVNGWTNIQATYDGSILKTYVNGVFISEFEGVSVNSGLGYRIGRCWDVAAYVTGEIGEVRIYNYPLTQEQVSADYNESAPTFTGGDGGVKGDGGGGGGGGGGVVSEDPFFGGQPIFASYNNGLFLFGGVGANSISASTDGLTWSKGGHPLGSGGIYAIAAGLDETNSPCWVVGGANITSEHTLAYSSNGVTWNLVENDPFVGGFAFSLVFLQGTKCVALGYINQNLRVAVSTTGGKTWQTVSVTNSYQFRIIISGMDQYSQPLLIIGGSSGGTYGVNTVSSMATSSDGISWTYIDLENDPYDGQILTVLKYIPETSKWIAGGTGDNTIVTSTDGVHWTTVYSNLNYDYNFVPQSITYNNGTYYVVSNTEINMITSTDLQVWTPSPVGLTINNIFYLNNLFIASVSNTTGTLATSSNGITWSVIEYQSSVQPVQPAPPTDLAYSREGLKLLLYWTPAAGAQSYTIESAKRIGNVYSQYQAMGTSELSNFLTPDLVVGSTYKFRVSAVYAAGSEGAEISDILIVTYPGAPLNVRYENTPTVNSICLLWDTPFNGGSPIVSYAINLYAGTGVIYTIVKDAGINRLEYNSGLPLGEDIKFVIQSVNSNHYSLTAETNVVRFDSVVSVQDITEIKNTFNDVTTGEAAAAAINTLIGNKPDIAIVTAVLANASPVMFTALVSNPAFIGKSVSIPSSVATTLYSNFADKSSLNTSLPLKINFPDVDGVTPPARGSNSKLAIDLTVDAYVSFKGCAGYGIHVVAGEQYFTTPSNPIGTLVHVGDIITFITDAGVTINSKVADLDIVLIPYTAPPVICFLGSAPILTPNGYSRIDSLSVGDLVATPSGTSVIEKIEKQVYMPSIDTNPYIIPEGRFGSNSRILISPRHKVCVNGMMIEARDLELLQEEQYEKIRYYNIQVTNYENIIVAGLEVESLQPLIRINIPLDTFNYIIENKYGGKITDEIKERCYLMNDGTMSVPMTL